jgi:hypothetical protein
MSKRRTKVGVPGVKVGVKVNDRDGPVNGVKRPQNWVRNGVVATKGHQPQPGRQQLVNPGTNLVNRLLNVERVHRNVARVNHLGQRKRVVGAQQPRALANVRRPKPGPRPKAGTRIKRNTNHGYVGRLDFINAWQACKGCRPGKPRDNRCIYLTNDVAIVGAWNFVGQNDP